MTSTAPPVHLPRSGLVIGNTTPETTSAGHREHVYPGSGKPIAQAPMGGQAEVEEAVTHAREGATRWQALPPDARRDALLNLAALIVDNADELSAMQTLEIGMPVRLTEQMPSVAAGHLRYYAGWCDKLGGDVLPTWPVRALDYTVDEPYGVVGIIIPWNGPLVSMGQMLGPALAAGNSVVVKPSELTPFVAGRVAQLALEAGFPPGTINVVPGGPDAGQALAGNTTIDKIHFTGSTHTAREVLDATRANITPVGLELGGKSAHLIFADADIRLAARLAMTGAVALSGQACANGTRLLIDKQIYDDVLAIITARLKRVPIGDPLDPKTMMGPVVSAAACDRILGIVNHAKENGSGRLITGGHRVGGELADGFFIEPTIFGEVDPGSELAQEEIFGPVLAALPFDTEDAAIQLANGTRYGLAAYVHTNDLRRAHRVSRALIAGNVWINGVPGPTPATPFGGTKHSGYGRIGGLAGIREFSRPKNIWLPI